MARDDLDEPGDDAAFIALQRSPRDYGAWAAHVRQRWEREHGVEWLHGAVWRSTRPPDDPQRPATFRFNPERAARYRAKLAELDAATRSGTHPRRRG